MILAQTGVQIFNMNTPAQRYSGNDTERIEIDWVVHAGDFWASLWMKGLLLLIQILQHDDSSL